jgi:hypothetical protein
MCLYGFIVFWMHGVGTEASRPALDENVKGTKLTYFLIDEVMGHVK